MVMVAARLREPWRKIAADKMDRDGELTCATLTQHLMLRLRRGDCNERGARVSAYLAQEPIQSTRDRGGEQSGKEDFGRDGGRGYERGSEGASGFRGENNSGQGRGDVQGSINFNNRRGPNDVCTNCGEHGRCRRCCPRMRCYVCGQTGHLSYA